MTKSSSREGADGGNATSSRTAATVESQSQHTPGPWAWIDYPDGRKLLCASNRAVIHCPDAPMGCEPADASLIAAAPDLLAALKAVVHMLRTDARGTDLNNRKYDALGAQAYAAIGKAEGHS